MIYDNAVMEYANSISISQQFETEWNKKIFQKSLIWDPAMDCTIINSNNNKVEYVHLLVYWIILQ